MPSKPARYSQADLNRAVKAVSKIDRACAIEAKPDGTIRIVFGDADEMLANVPVKEDWRL